MSTSIAEFWKLLEKSRLVGPEHCHALAQQFGQLKGVSQQGNAQTLAEWLVAQQAISRYQAKVLLAGKSGPFFYDNYVLFDRVADGPLKGCFRALHPASRHIVSLHFFEAEARAEEWHAAAETVLTAAAWQGHPHLQDLYQLQESGKKRFVAVGDQPGISLDKVLAKQQRLPPHEACRIVREMLLGLNVMHQAGAVHGAIRPVNIILAPNTNQAVLLQPPVARPFWPIPGTVDLSPYTNDQLMVQVDYMAPELAHAGVTANPLTDIYAAGCLLYHLLSGRPPFAGGEVASKFMRHASEPVQPLEPLGVPPQLAQVVMYTMAKDPAIRYQSAAQLIEALTFFVDPRALQVVPQVAPTLGPFLGWLREQPAIPTSLDQELYGTPPTEQIAAPAFPAAELGGSRGPGRATKPLELGGSTNNSESLVAMLAERKKRSQQRMVFGGAAALAVLMIAFVVYKATSRDDRPEEDPVPVAVNTPAKGKNPPAQTPTSVVTPDKTPPEPLPMEQPKAPVVDPKSGADEGKTSLIDDDGKALWASPTSGAPLNFSELPPSAQIFMSVRPWDLLNKNRFNPKLFAAAGPLAEMGRAKVEAEVGLNFNEINLLQIAWVAAPDGLTPVYYVRAKDRAAAEQWKQKLGTLANETIGDKAVSKGAKLMYYWPAADNGMRMIAAYPAQMQEMLTAPARTHPKVEKLLKSSDEQRLLNLIVSTNYLFGDGATALPGQTPLIKKLEQVLSYDTTALGLSVHLDDQNFFTELKMQPSASHTPNQAAMLFKEQMRGWEAGATSFVGEALQKNNQAYGFNVLMALPRRIGKFTSMTRADEDQGVIVVRSYLNASAAEHLMQGVELALAYSGTGAGAPQLAMGTAAPAAGTGGTPAPAQPTGNTPADKLKKVISLTFDRDTLEKSMVMLGEELGTPIEILGGDLQLEGITKNQSFGLDEKNKTGSEILQVIMKKANPDGKLVYIIKPKTPGGEDMIFITTRSAVEKRKDKLPPELVIEAKPPAKK